jgi:hypothetical protein
MSYKKCLNYKIAKSPSSKPAPWLRLPAEYAIVDRLYLPTQLTISLDLGHYNLEWRNQVDLKIVMAGAIGMSVFVTFVLTTTDHTETNIVISNYPKLEI